MPGILPMKVIKIGTNSQSRIAQACDRCRSKKIRCDGITPCCSQCANVGFECKTSDKLSRRAFPRGYTESLEERVRILEAEVKELKDLLDEKDEKIDILSKIHSNSPRRSAPSSRSTPVAEPAPVPKKEEVFKLQQSSFLVDSHRSELCFMGASSGRGFVDALKVKLQETGKPCSNFNTKVFFNTGPTTAPSLDVPSNSSYPTSAVPPRLLSDQLINIFFQEWAPLFPVLHRPTFLQLYANYTADPDSVKDLHSVAQLYLVFSIAAISTECNKELLASFERSWQSSLECVSSDVTLATVQCLVLAQIYYICRADYEKLLQYNGTAVTLAFRLGLHQSQKRFSLGALTRETRKKVFWTLYTLDCFSAASLGVPTLLKYEDIQTEYPSDVDDENVTERGFQPTLPGESTKVSSALALFRLARIMSKTLSEIYPSSPSYDISMQTIASLDEELEGWRDGLAPHLRLEFVQDKPSTNVISSRSPLLSLAYYYTRTLIHRPVVGSLGEKASSSVVALADSSKHIVQIVQLLEERRMSFSICLSKNELLLLAGFGLLFQGLDLKQEGKLIRDNQRLVCSIIELLERGRFSAATDFKRLACSMIAIERFAKPSSPSHCRSDSTNSAGSVSSSRSMKKQLQAITSRLSFGKGTKGSPMPRPVYRPNSLTGPIKSEPMVAQTHDTSSRRMLSTPIHHPNLDYLSFNNSPSLQPAALPDKSPYRTHSWEHLLGYVDVDGTNLNSSQPNLHTRSPGDQFNTIAPSPSNDLLLFQPYSLPMTTSPADSSSNIHDWSSPEAWNMLDAFQTRGSRNGSNSGASGSGLWHGESGESAVTGIAPSVFSISEESLTSGTDPGDAGCEFRNLFMGGELEDNGFDLKSDGPAGIALEI